MASRYAAYKRLLVGRPIASEHAEHQLLPKFLALPVFSSDALSSVAYATQEMTFVLVLAGTAAIAKLVPVSIAVASLMAIVVISYRQTVRAYPSGGGAYLVSKDNLSEGAGVVAASALLVDYVLTVSVSIAAGVDAILAASGRGLLPWRVTLGVFFIVLVAAANLRGVKESGALFALPTYLFIVGILALIGTGFAQCLGGCRQAAVPDARFFETTQTLTLLLLLRAFSSGSTALTGVEAISNGVQVFRRPQAKNAATTLALMGGIGITMFLGISVLARRLGVQSSEHFVSETGKTVVSQVAETVFGRGFMFFFVQATTAAILILAANTAFQGFPLLSAILARDRYLPRQFMNRGDRLVFSNGVVVLGTLAVILVLAFGGQVNKLIQLYVVGVFTSFTLSQSGMVVHWRKTREPGWQWRIVPSAVGAAATAVVLVITIYVKFLHGAWIVIIAIPGFVLLMSVVHRHYKAVGLQLRTQEGRYHPPAAINHALLLAAHTGPATRKAMNYITRIRPATLRVLHLDERGDEVFLDNWQALYPDHPLEVVRPRHRQLGRAVAVEVERLRAETPNGFLTVVIPELLRSRSWSQFLGRRHGLQIKRALLEVPGIIVTDVTYIYDRRGRKTLRDTDHVGVLTVVASVSGVTQPTLQCLDYARSLNPDQFRVVHAEVEEDQALRMARDWEADALSPPLEILTSSYRGVAAPLRAFVRRIRRGAGKDSIVNVVLPEFIVPGLLGKALHNQTALAVKAAFLFEPHVLVTSVPYHLVSTREARRRYRRFGTVRVPQDELAAARQDGVPTEAAVHGDVRGTQDE